MSRQIRFIPRHQTLLHVDSPSPWTFVSILVMIFKFPHTLFPEHMSKSVSDVFYSRSVCSLSLSLYWHHAALSRGPLHLRRESSHISHISSTTLTPEHLNYSKCQVQLFVMSRFWRSGSHKGPFFVLSYVFFLPSVRFVTEIARVNLAGLFRRRMHQNCDYDQ